MLPIDPRQLASLLAIAEHGSFNRAAAARGVSQPALSGSIAQLERKLAVSVVSRNKNGSTLTPFGEILVRHAQNLSALLDQANEEVRLKRLGVEGHLRIGATPSLLLKFLPTVLGRLCREVPNLSLAIVEGLDDQLIPSLQAGTLDMIFAPSATTFPAPSDIVEDPLFDDPLALAVGPKSPLARRKFVTLTELQHAAWVLPGPGSAYRRLVEALFLSSGITWPANCVTTNSLTLAESLVAESDRICLVSRLQTMMHNTSRIRAIPLKGAGTRTVALKWRRSSKLSPLSQRLAQIAHEASQFGPKR